MIARALRGPLVFRAYLPVRIPLPFSGYLTPLKRFCLLSICHGGYIMYIRLIPRDACYI